MVDMNFVLYTPIIAGAFGGFTRAIAENKLNPNRVQKNRLLVVSDIFSGAFAGFVAGNFIGIIGFYAPLPLGFILAISALAGYAGEKYNKRKSTQLANDQLLKKDELLTRAKTFLDKLNQGEDK